MLPLPRAGEGWGEGASFRRVLHWRARRGYGEGVMEQFKQYLVGTQIAGNEIWRVGALFLAVLAAFVAGKVGRGALLAAARRAEERGAGFAAVVLGACASFVTFVAFAIGLKAGLAFLLMNEAVSKLAGTVGSVVMVCAITWAVYCLVDVVDYWLAQLTRKTRSRMDDMLAPLVRKSLRVTIVVLGLLQVATTLSDKPVTSLLAGLGVGGLAIALAAQDSIKNFFGSLIIFADKPFELGDRIVVGGHDGPVEEVGFRSTRIRTLDGHLVTIPNGELANQMIQNIGKRPYIKRTANITITYDTPPEKVRRAVEIIRELLRDHEGMQPGFPARVYFNEFNSASLNILVIYWYHPPDYWKYLAFSAYFNTELLRRFNEEGIEFAFPTQTLYLAGDPKRPLKM